MNSNHEVLSAFLDDEPFEPQALAEALADPAGRELLIDFVLLRHVAQSEEPARVSTPMPTRRPKSALHWAAAAAVVVALVSGYLLGQRQSADDSSQPPAATRVVQSEPAWQELRGVR